MSSTDAFSALASLNERFAAADASSGSVKRPPAGVHPCLLTMIEITDAEFTINKDQGTKTPAKSVLFRYKTMADPTEPKPYDFPGKAFIIPLSTSGFEKNKLQQIDIDLGRLKNHLQIILGKPVTNLVASLSEAQAKVSTGGGVTGGVTVVKVNCVYDKDKKDATKVYFKDYLTGLLATN
jgi:hypothetical protein